MADDVADFSDDKEKEIPKNWLTKYDVAAQLGKSLQAVVRAQKAGKLHPRSINGENRYDPKEVSALLEEKRDKASEYAEYELETVRQLLDIIKDPRVQIDNLLFKIIERLEAQNEKLVKQLEDNRVVVEAAKDNASERDIAKSIIDTEGKVKAAAIMKFMDTLGRVTETIAARAGKDSKLLTDDQLQELLLTEDFFNDAQKDEVKKILEKRKAAKQAITVPVEAAKEINNANAG